MNSLLLLLITRLYIMIMNYSKAIICLTIKQRRAHLCLVLTYICVDRNYALALLARYDQ